MPILYSTIKAQLVSALDAEGSDRYTDNNDYIPAINYAIDYVTLVFNSIFAKKKLSEEVLKELTYVKVWQASLLSRIAFTPSIVGVDLWTIFAVYLKCSTISTYHYVPPTPSNESNFLQYESYVDSQHSAKRITLEEWTYRNTNIFTAGSPLVACPELIEYAWINFANYTGGYVLANSPQEIGISPNVAGQKVAIAFLSKPTKVVTITDNIQFPDVLLNLLVNTALKFISFKQNNKSTLLQVSSMDSDNIIKLLS